MVPPIQADLKHALALAPADAMLLRTQRRLQRTERQLKVIFTCYQLFDQFICVQIIEIRYEKASKVFFKDKIFGAMQRENLDCQREEARKIENEVYGEMPGLE